MSDESLRELERRARETGGRTDWLRFYAAKRRTGWDQLAGRATWRVTLPDFGEPMNLIFPRHEPVTTAEEIELEWSRCGTGVAVTVYQNKDRPDCVVPWQECLHTQALDTRVYGLGQARIPERNGLDLARIASLLMPQDRITTTTVFLVDGPEFLEDPLVIARTYRTRPPERPRWLEPPNERQWVEAHAARATPYWARGIRERGREPSHNWSHQKQTRQD